MRKRDIDLIAALVEGRLEDEAEARALVESSSSHRAEYEAQKLAFDSLRTLPRVELTDHERSALRRDVWTELKSQPTETTRRTPWYQRWSYAAVGLVVIVGLVAVINQSARLDSADQTATEAFQEIGSGLGDVAESTVAASATTAAAAAAPEDGAAGLNYAATASDVENLSSLANSFRLGEETAFSTLERGAEEGCLEDAGLIEHEVVGEVETEMVYLVAVPAGEEIGPETPISFIDAATCQLAYTDQ